MESTKIQYIYSGKSKNKLVVLFQAAGVKWYNKELFFKRNDSIEDRLKYDEYLYNVHERYNYYKYFLDKEYDVLSIADNYCDSFGWYVLNDKRCIVKEIVSFLDFYISKYPNGKIVFFGSSKGAYGALTFAQYFSKRIQVLALYPVINPISFYNEHKNREDFLVQKELLNLNYWDENLELFFDRNISLDNVSLKVILGKNEYQSYLFMKKIVSTTKGKVILDLENHNHDGYLKNALSRLDYLLKEDSNLNHLIVENL